LQRKEIVYREPAKTAARAAGAGPADAAKPSDAPAAPDDANDQPATDVAPLADPPGNGSNDGAVGDDAPAVPPPAAGPDGT
jgi:hypothetical protein